MHYLGMGIQYLTTDFDRIEEACGSRYVAIQWLTKETRRLEELTKHYNIPESKMITWALTGECPYSDVELEIRRRPTLLDRVDDLLEFVDDYEVKQQVRTFYKLSVKNKGLTLCDRVELGESRLSRVNILLRMAWNNF